MWMLDKNTEKASSTSITALELKQLLLLLSRSVKISFRFRAVGEMWMRNHMQVNTVNEKSVLLYDDNANRYAMVKINRIIQFDLDNRFQNYQPHFHYSVTPSVELE
jgi:hypothetical protein